MSGKVLNTVTLAVVAGTVALGATAAVVLIHDTGTRRVASSAPPSVAASPSPSALPASPVPPAVAPSASVTNPTAGYLGLAAPGAGWTPEAAWQAATGTTPGMVEAFTEWPNAFPAPQLAVYREHGALPLVAWDPGKTRFESITSGTQDAYLERFASAVAAFGTPVAVSFAHEFNGNWYPWGTQSESPAAFVAAWRHIHNVFASVGAANAIWVWTPNVVNPVPNVSLRAYWPGDDYVTWVGLVGYWTGRLGEDSWASLFGASEHIVAGFTDKRVLVVETGVQQGTDKALWTTLLLKGAAADKRLVGLVYFDYGLAQGKRADWTLTHDSAAVLAWRGITARWAPGRLGAG